MDKWVGYRNCGGEGIVNIGSNRIIWTEESIDDLRQRLTQYELEDYEEEDEVDETEEIIDSEQFEESEPPSSEVDPISTVVPPIQPNIDFPWPISLKSTTFSVSGGKTSGADVVLTWTDIPEADAYEVRITGA